MSEDQIDKPLQKIPIVLNVASTARVQHAIAQALTTSEASNGTGASKIPFTDLGGSLPGAFAVQMDADTVSAFYHQMDVVMASCIAHAAFCDAQLIAQPTAQSALSATSQSAPLPMAHVSAPPAAPLEIPPVTMNQGWVAAAEWNNTTGDPIVSFVASITVPPAPTQNDYQAILLYISMLDAEPNGLQESNSILQPVLQWGVTAAGGGACWSVGSWYVSSDKTVRFTPLTQVKEGDQLVARIRCTHQAGTAFDYLCEFVGYRNTQLRIVEHRELKCACITLEAFNVLGCSDFPDTQKTAFTAIAIRTDSVPATLDWALVDKVTDCGQKAVVVDPSSSAGEIDLYFNS